MRHPIQIIGVFEFGRDILSNAGQGKVVGDWCGGGRG
jgi:hypothetical protein